MLGKAVSVPGSNTSDEAAASRLLAAGQDMEAEQRLDLRCRARQAFLEADNNQAIRSVLLRRSKPSRGPCSPGQHVSSWIRKRSPNRLASGRWCRPAQVICSEGQSVVWVSHDSSIPQGEEDPVHTNVGGASSFISLILAYDGSLDASGDTDLICEDQW